ncbi:MAG: helix-turn-helix transcriptional regulator [Halobacteriovoraceae bacterium]|jgi:transcriptional regulator with XRE-family HTH domain|nr:helix-turn-helix transcriptional regulator [Halobacteriovoraceae bacterium]
MEIEISKTLKILIEEKGITLTALSKHTGVPISTLNNWLSGQEPRSISQVKDVAKFFDHTIDQLCFPIDHLPVTKAQSPIESYQDEIYAGVYEVILRKTRTK